jgi:citrate synthase
MLDALMIIVVEHGMVSHVIAARLIYHCAPEAMQAAVAAALCGAGSALYLGYPWQITKAFALIGRTLGAIGHIAEEIQNPMAAQVDAAVKQALVYEPVRT